MKTWPHLTWQDVQADEQEQRLLGEGRTEEAIAHLMRRTKLPAEDVCKALGVRDPRKAPIGLEDLILIAIGREAIDWWARHGLGGLYQGERWTALSLDEAVAALAEGGLIELRVDPEAVRRIEPSPDAETWWEALAYALDEGALPRSLEPIRTELRSLALDLDPEIILPRRWAAELMAWAATLPGWSDGDERPLSCGAVH